MLHVISREIREIRAYSSEIKPKCFLKYHGRGHRNNLQGQRSHMRFTKITGKAMKFRRILAGDNC